MSNEPNGGPNAEQIRYWNEQPGPKWVALQAQLDAQLAAARPARHGARAIVAGGETSSTSAAAAAQTTLELARARRAAAARCSASTSRRRCSRRAPRARRGGGLRNVALRRAPTRRRTASRRRAVDVVLLALRRHVLRRPDGRLRQPAPRAAARRTPRVRLLAGAAGEPVDGGAAGRGRAARAAARAAGAATRRGRSPSPTRDRVRGILDDAGFADVDFEPAHDELTVGGTTDLDEAVEFLLTLGPVGGAARRRRATRCAARWSRRCATRSHPTTVRTACACRPRPGSCGARYSR